MAECIVRYDLKNECKEDFNISKVLGINEMGMPTQNIEKLTVQLKDEIKLNPWKGDLVRFGTIGSPEGIFLLPNYEIKQNWFPTSMKITSEPFKAIIEHEGLRYLLEFKEEQLKTKKSTS